MKNGEIILCKGIKMDKNYDNTLSYSENNMVTLCRNNKIAESTKYSILDPIKGEMDVAIPYASCIYANYIAFKNTNVGNKWYFAFVNDVEYVNPATTKIHYQVDVFSTWYSKFNIGQAFIQREHVDDDTFGKHTVPEKLETGEFIINAYENIDEFAVDDVIVASCTKLPKEIMETVISGSTVPTKMYNGTFSGLFYITFKTVDDATKFLLIMDGQGIGDAVYSVFQVPKSILSTSTLTYTTTSCTGELNYPTLNLTFSITFSIEYMMIPNSGTATTMKSNHTVTRNTTLNGYTPKNNKMFTGEFNYMYVTSNGGDESKFNYEDFYNASPSFNLYGAITPGGSTKLIPKNYMLYNQSTGEHDTDTPWGLTGCKYPVCSWVSDSYTNWLTQQCANTNMGTVLTSVGQLAVGLAIGNPTAIVGSMETPIEEAYQQQIHHDTMPPQAKGNINAGDIIHALGKNQFFIYKMSIKYEFAKRIDDYLSRYGYKVNEIKTPNLNSRTKFNYIKVGGTDELISGDIPASDLEKINAIFRKGTTIFHDYSTFGNYTQTNSIVTP